MTNVFEYLPDAVVLTDRRGVITGANGKAGAEYFFDKTQEFGKVAQVLREVVKNRLNIKD